MSDEGSVKISANLSNTIVNALKEIAEKRGISMTEALRQAISHERYFVAAAEKNEKILLEDRNGKIREVVMDPIAGTSR